MAAVKHPMKRVPRELWGIVNALVNEYRTEKNNAAKAVESDVIEKLMTRVVTNG